MPGLLENCRTHFETDNLYSVLGIKKSASESKVKKGYHKVSLKVHPDRLPEEEKGEATLKFQTLGKVYCILSNKEKRAVYDETGEVDDEDDVIPQDRDWTAYWRLLFRKVTTEDLEDFEKNYKGSKEELEDIQTAYVEFKGDMTEILNNVMCSTIEDEQRFTKIIKGWIKKKTVPDFPAFSKENKKSKDKRKREADKEAAEAEELKQELGLEVDDSLKKMIQQRQSSRESQMEGFFDQLEAKYAQPKKQKTSTDSSNIVEHEPNKYDELLFSYKWKTRGKEWLKVERVSTERSMELHGGNCCSARAALNLRIRMKEEGHPVRAGRFMPGEDDIIVENVLKYRNEFPAFHPIELLNSAKSKKQLITAKETSFYSKIAEGLNRTIVDVYYRLKYILFPYYTISRKGTLTSMEIVHLKKLHQKHGSKWTTIGKIMGRNVRSLSKIWQQKQATKFGIWDETEDSLLTRSIKQYRENTESSDKDLHNALQWEIIAKAIPGRSAVQCRNHWLNKLRNRVFKEEKYFETVSWSQDQTIELVSNICQQEVRHEEDVDFDIIRKHFQDAGFVVSRGQIRRQWHTMKIKVKNYLLKSFEEILDEVASLTPEHCNGTNYLLSTVD